MRIIDKNTWKRKEHYEFFSEYDDPFFGITSEIECSNAYEFCKKTKYHSLHITCINLYSLQTK